MRTLALTVSMISLLACAGGGGTSGAGGGSSSGLGGGLTGTGGAGGAGGTGVGGAGGGSSGTGGGAVSAPSGFFIDSGPGSTNGNEPQLAIDGTGRVHMIYSAISSNGSDYPVRYGSCTSNCGARESWTFISVVDHDTLGGHARLAVDAAGRVRIAFELANISAQSVAIAQCDGNCTQGSSWSAGAVRGFSSGSYLIGDGANLAFGAGGKLMLAYLGGSLGFEYGECSSNCTTPAGWTFTQLSAGQLAPVLAATTSGAPRIIFQDRVSRVLGYAQCDANCTSAASWVILPVLYYLGSERYALAVDGQNRLRIAWNQGQTGIAAEAMNDRKVYYGWCNGSCGDAASWQGFGTGLPADNGTEGLGLVVDGNGEPALVYDASPSPYTQSLLICTSGCNTGSAAWSTVALETDAAITAQTPAPKPMCSGGVGGYSYWFPGQEAAVVVNGTALNVVHATYTLEKCSSSGTFRTGVTLPRFVNVPF